jgi:hypothetical protein
MLQYLRYIVALYCDIGYDTGYRVVVQNKDIMGYQYDVVNECRSQFLL